MRERSKDARYPRADDFLPMGVRCGHVAMATHQLSISLHWHSLERRKHGEEEDSWGDGESLHRGALRGLRWFCSHLAWG